MGASDVVIELTSEQETRRLGRRIACRVRAGDVVLLLGELGAGKTTLVQGLVDALGDAGGATSPTFALCHRYATSPPVAHVDCWRMQDPAELEDLGLDELLDDGWVVVAEWGELLEPRYGAEALIVELQRAPAGRSARLWSRSQRWEAEFGRVTAQMRDRSEGPC